MSASSQNHRPIIRRIGGKRDETVGFIARIGNGLQKLRAVASERQITKRSAMKIVIQIEMILAGRFRNPKLQRAVFQRARLEGHQKLKNILVLEGS